MKYILLKENSPLSNIVFSPTNNSDIIEFQQKFYSVKDYFDLYNIYHQNIDKLSLTLKKKSYLFLSKILENASEENINAVNLKLNKLKIIQNLYSNASKNINFEDYDQETELVNNFRHFKCQYRRLYTNILDESVQYSSNIDQIQFPISSLEVKYILEAWVINSGIPYFQIYFENFEFWKDCDVKFHFQFTGLQANASEQLEAHYLINNQEISGVSIINSTQQRWEMVQKILNFQDLKSKIWKGRNNIIAVRLYPKNLNNFGNKYLIRNCGVQII